MHWINEIEVYLHKIDIIDNLRYIVHYTLLGLPTQILSHGFCLAKQTSVNRRHRSLSGSRYVVRNRPLVKLHQQRGVLSMARTQLKSKTVKTIPSSEIEKVSCFTKPNSSGDEYIITQNQLKQQFTLWKCVEDGFEKISTSNSPSNLDENIPYEM